MLVNSERTQEGQAGVGLGTAWCGTGCSEFCVQGNREEVLTESKFLFSRLGWGLKVCVSNKFPALADAAEKDPCKGEKLEEFQGEVWRWR